MNLISPDNMPTLTHNAPNDDPLLAAIDHGNAFLQSGDAPKALTQFEEALKILAEKPDKMMEARVLGLKGGALRQIGNPKQALQAFNKALNISEKIDFDLGCIDSLTQIGKLHLESEELGKGLKNLEHAFQIAVKANDDGRQLYIAGLLGNAFLLLDQPGKAIENFGLANQIARDLNRPESVVSTHLSQAGAFLKLDEAEEAQSQLQKALDVASKLKKPEIELTVFEQLLRLSLHTRDRYGVKFHSEFVFRFARQLNAPQAEANSLQAVIDFLLEEEDTETTLPLLARGLELAAELEDTLLLTNFTMNLGVAHYNLGDYQPAEEHLLRALDHARQVLAATEQAYILSRLCALKADQDDLPTAQEYGQQALDIAREQDLPVLKGQLLMLLALNAQDAGEAAAAREYLDEAALLYEALDMPDQVEQAQLLLAELG